MLSEDDFHLPEDVEVLRRENELLALENQLLRARVGSWVSRADAQKQIDRAVRAEREKGREAVHRTREKYEADKAERRARFASVPHERLRQYQKAEADLGWLVGRLDGSPLGVLLRRRPGWQALVERSRR